MHFEVYADVNRTEAFCMDTQDCIVCFLSYFVYMHFEFIFCCITAVACISFYPFTFGLSFLLNLS